MSQVPVFGIFFVFVEHNYKKEKREKKEKKRKKKKKKRKERERKEEKRFINLNLNFQALLRFSSSLAHDPLLLLCNMYRLNLVCRYSIDAMLYVGVY